MTSEEFTHNFVSFGMCPRCDRGKLKADQEKVMAYDDWTVTCDYCGYTVKESDDLEEALHPAKVCYECCTELIERKGEYFRYYCPKCNMLYPYLYF